MNRRGERDGELKGTREGMSNMEKRETGREKED